MDEAEIKIVCICCLILHQSEGVGRPVAVGCLAMSTAVWLIAGLTSITATNCVQYSLSMTYFGRYCTSDGIVTYPQLPHHCRYLCLQSATCKAYNYNSTENTCTHFSSPCPLAFPDTAMELTVLTEIPINQCYEWVTYAQRDPIDQRRIHMHPTYQICRMTRAGNDILCYFHLELSQCIGYLGSTQFTDRDGSPCQRLRVIEDCAVFWVPYVARDPIPTRAVEAGHIADGNTVHVTKVVVIINNKPRTLTGHHFLGADKSCCIFARRVLCNSAMMMLVVL